MWMSLAPRFTASPSTTLTSFTTGASSAAFSSSASSIWCSSDCSSTSLSPISDIDCITVSRSSSLADPREDGAVGGNHRLDIETGHELDIVHREDVGGSDHRDGERGADPAQGK